MRRLHSRVIVTVVTALLCAGTAVFAAGTGAVTAGAAVTDAPFQVVVQTMDSCKSGLAGGGYALTGPAGSFRVDGSGPSSPGSIGTSTTCPLQQGNCSGTTKGCLVFSNVPAGDYRLRQVAIPSSNPTNPSGYAPCEGGSACWWEQADVTVSWDGSVAAVVTNKYPNGQVVSWPSFAGHAATYAGIAADPIVFHDFGLDSNAVPKPAPPAVPVAGTHYQCDGDSDADDWSTGTPSGVCAYPESSESSVCPAGSPAMFPAPTPTPPTPTPTYVFPWTCGSGPSTVQHFSVVSGNAAFVANLYKDALGRTSAPAASELQYWVGRILAGASRADVANGFVDSTEAHGHVVDADYQLLLLRAPDAGGRAYWVGQLDHGVFNETIVGLFGGSKEYYYSQLKGKGDNLDLVLSLYTDILRRTPSASDAGVQFWLGWLQHNHASILATQFANSHEYHLFIVNGWYHQYLGRQSDAPGAEFWATYLDNGHSDDAGIISIIASDEYFLKSGPVF